MTIRAVDCQGFAGGFTLGTVQAGLTLVAKREMQGGFGVANCEANRHLLGYDWTSESVDPLTWSAPPGGAEVVFGNPPCSGFSGLSSKEFRGMNSPINECMWAFVEYAAKVKPLIAVFESVRAAYSKGRPLMRDLRARLEARTGLLWNLHHVVHDAYALGGPAIRRRYFWVASRIPFGVEYPELPFAPTLHDAIGDLETLELTLKAQPYTSPPTRWSSARRALSNVVDGHVVLNNPHAKRLADLAAMIGWRPGHSIGEESRRCYETHGTLPESWRGTQQHIIERNFDFGFSGTARWPYDAPARVVTGAGPNIAVHPALDRTLTHRETARILGFPDDWLIEPLRNVPGLASTWGKGITVDAGRWIATWIGRSIEGEPGEQPWVQVGNRELEVVISKPRVCGSVVQVAQRMQQIGELHMTAPQAPTPPAPPMFATGPVAPPAAAPAAPVAPTAPAAPAPSAESTSDAPSSRGRGRGRPNDVVERDAKVLAAVTAEGITREAIAAAIGIDTVRVYQSLWRLRRDGLVERAREGRGHSWKRTGAAPQVAQPAAEPASEPEPASP